MTRITLNPVSSLPSYPPSPLPLPTNSSDYLNGTVPASRSTGSREQALHLAFERSLEAEGRLAPTDRLHSSSSSSSGPTDNKFSRLYSRTDILEAEYASREYLTSRIRDLERVLRKVNACTSQTTTDFDEIRGEIAALLGNGGEWSGAQNVALRTNSETLEAHAGKAERVDAELMIPGRGEPVRDASLVFEGKTILYAGTTAGLPAKWRRLSAVEVPVLMPGMWDW